MDINDYVLTDAVLHPITKENVDTYILKENMKVAFAFANHQISSQLAIVSNYYYRPYKNKNLIIRCMDTYYPSSVKIDLVPQSLYSVMKATGKLENCLFVYDINYTVNENGEDINKNKKFYFKIVSEKEYDMYKSMKKEDTNVTEDGVIKRPKAIK